MGRARPHSTWPGSWPCWPGRPAPRWPSRPAVRALDAAAGQAATAARSEDAARERAATAEIIRAARHARWLALQESAVPLVAELAAGTADPGDPQVRIRCAVQAARLRRLMAEGDEVPGSLVHELHASADVAELRGVAVEIETAGTLPPVPGPARRVITDAAIAILTAARSQARITLATVAAGIAVSFVADTGSVVLLPSAGAGGRHRTPARRRHALGGGAMEQQVTVAIIEDHPVVTEGVASWIRSDPGQRVLLVHTARDLTGLSGGVAAAGRRGHPRPGAVRRAGHRRRSPGWWRPGTGWWPSPGTAIPVIVMETLDNGAHAYVSKEEGSDHLVEAVLAAAADRPYVTRSQARAMLADQRPGRPALSQQELQALLLWFQGMSKASVGRRMSISENTVRQYISRARAKYAATGRTAPSKDALLARAIEDGVIKPGEIMPYQSFARAAANRPSLGAPGQ